MPFEPGGSIPKRGLTGNDFFSLSLIFARMEPRRPGVLGELRAELAAGDLLLKALLRPAAPTIILRKIEALSLKTL
jgi:hypothetical protein